MKASKYFWQHSRHILDRFIYELCFKSQFPFINVQIPAARCSKMKRDKAVMTFCCLTKHLCAALPRHPGHFHTLNTPVGDARIWWSIGMPQCEGRYLYGNIPQSNYITPGTAIATVPTAGSARELHRQHGDMVMTPVYADYLGSGLLMLCQYLTGLLSTGWRQDNNDWRNPFQDGTAPVRNNLPPALTTQLAILHP